MHSVAHVRLLPSSGKSEPSAAGEGAAGSFGKPHASAAVAFHLLLLCVVLLRKVVRLLMEQSEAS